MPSSTQLQPVSRRRSRSISDIERSAICRYGRRHPSLSSSAVRLWAQEELGVGISQNTVSRLMKKAREIGSINPSNVLHNILDEYTKELIIPSEVQTKQYNDRDPTSKSPDSPLTNGQMDDSDRLPYISPVDVKKYLQAWIIHLQNTNHPDKDRLVYIAGKHLQILERNILNTKIQTTINCYFKCKD